MQPAGEEKKRRIGKKHSHLRSRLATRSMLSRLLPVVLLLAVRFVQNLDDVRNALAASPPLDAYA